jgi:4-amino-4-deoxy-L-arabinose transferase-like glycosyltransferase
MASMQGFPLRKWILVALALLAGAALRIQFLRVHPEIGFDALRYGDIAKNWITHGVYGLSTFDADGSLRIHPTLLRLPGYPLFLAACFTLFGLEHYMAVMRLQLIIDLGTCLLIAAFVRRIASERAAMIALWMAALCPFTANYVASPLTECLSIFCVALALYAFVRLLEQPTARWIALLAAAISYAALLRPDGALLGIALCPAILLYRRRAWGMTRALRIAAVCSLLSVLPFLPWTLRNWRTFHVFQPLAPRYATDPGEFIDIGFIQWTRTWCAEFTSTSEIYWNADSDQIDIAKLPSRAFDSPQQREQTAAALDAYNAKTTVTPDIDKQFAALARERTRTHPLRTWVEMPLRRMADMWLRPRLEMMWFELRWWQYDQHHDETVKAWAYAALNAGYLLLALIGIWRWPRLSGVMLAFILLRCALLATVEAPEPRYTLECFPMVIAWAAVALSRRQPLKHRSS